MDLSFIQPGLLERMEAADSAALDAAPFGFVGTSLDGTVIDYNAIESQLTGLEPATVIGRHFFSQVAPCTNNFMVAQRFETAAALDEIVNYVFTLRVQPTKVRLRLLKRPGHSRMFLAVERR
jgi:photoactive yellow protein